MTSIPKGLLPRGDWLRLRTLTTLRWMTIAGQIAAISFAYHVMDVHLPIVLCYLAVGAAIWANLACMMAFPGNRRLTEMEAMATLIFDMVQLSVLVYLTGGLSNPFVLLILAPVVISASALGLSTTIAIAVCATTLVTTVSVHHLPMELSDGTLLATPQLFTVGFWLSMVIGIAFTSVYAHRVSTEIRTTSNALLATQMALAREQKLTDLGGVVAAAAHELGTPLATIKLVSAELMEELKDNPDLAEDAALIRDQANRCRDILQSMGRAGKDDPHMRQAPLSALLRDAAEPHLSRGKAVEFAFSPMGAADEKMPTVLRSAEVIHGLRNLIQNAVDFSRSTVWIDGCWDEDTILVRITDDGAGFASQIIGRIGEPFVRPRRTAAEIEARPEYEGMGLGLFIAKTLLERTGARLRFANAADPFLAPQERIGRSGAVVEVSWARVDLESVEGPLGENLPLN